MILVCISFTRYDNVHVSEYQTSIRGRWKAGVNAGGWLECPTFDINPQYIITIHHDGKSLNNVMTSCICLFAKYKISKGLFTTKYNQSHYLLSTFVLKLL